MDLYFKRHDGSAVTCDDFLAAMADANGADLAALGRWYQQAGTPSVEVEGTYDAAAKTYTLKCVAAWEGAQRGWGWGGVGGGTGGGGRTQPRPTRSSARLLGRGRNGAGVEGGVGWGNGGGGRTRPRPTRASAPAGVGWGR